ncbi:MAG: glycosyltransferase family 4 protein [Cryomorphaceae bacterium]|nr:glycosyltransferase family 4 protein [Cryomorphaceae bacterium]
MRVLHVSSAKTWRGGEQQVAYLIHALGKLGVNQQLACIHNGELHKKMQGFIDCIPYKKKSALNLSFAWRLKRLCKDVDLIHVHDSHAHTAAYISARLGNTTPIVVHRRVDFPISKGASSKRKYNHPSIAKIICVSHLIKAVVEKGIIAQEKAVTVHSGVDPKRFDKPSDALHNLLGLSSDTPLVGNSSALADHKDYPTFLKTAAEVLKSKPNAHFVIFGEGEERTNIEAKIKSLNIQDHVHLTGFRNDLTMLLPCLDVFFMPSKTEGLGTSILDAFAAEVPVVSTRAGGIPEIVIHQQTGLTSEIGDYKSLSRQITSILSNDELREQLVKNANAHLQSFTTEKMGGKVLGIYREVLKG